MVMLCVSVFWLNLFMVKKNSTRLGCNSQFRLQSPV
jgi:hypothetical protein